MSNCRQALHPRIIAGYLWASALLATAIILIAPAQPAFATYLTVNKSSGKSIDVSINLIPDLNVEISDGVMKISGLGKSNGFFDPDASADSVSIKITSYFFYNSCDKHIEVTNNVSNEYGNKVVFTRNGVLECVVSVLGKNGVRLASWLIWNPKCSCFIKIDSLIHPEYTDIYNYIIQPIIDDLRKQYSEPLADTEKAAQLIANKDPSLPEDAVDLTEVLRQVEDARQRSLEAGESRDELLARLREKSAANVAEAQEEEEEPEEAAPSTAQSRAPSVPNDQVVFTVENGATKPIVVSFFEFPNQESNSPSRYYPNRGRSWILNDGKQQDYRLICTPGRIVCMGSEFQFDRKSQSGVFWGVSVDAREQCPKCCLRCGGKSAAWKLTWDGQRHPPQVARRDDNRGGGNANTAQALGVILGTVAGVAGAVQNSRRAPITYDSSLSAPPRAPAWKPSGISQ